MKTTIMTILTLTALCTFNNSYACSIQEGIYRQQVEPLLTQKDSEFVPGSLRINDQHTRYQVGSVLRTGLARLFTRQNDCHLDGSTRQVTYAKISYQRMNGDFCDANVVVRQGVKKDRLKIRTLDCQSLTQAQE